MKKALLLFALLAQTIVFGAQTGKIKGRVIDSNNEPLYGVNVVVLGTSLGAATDLDGYFMILNIPAGIYELKASAIGYNAVTTTNVRVSIDLTTEINFTLSEESIQLNQDIVVVAEKPIVQKDLTASTSIVGADLISELPVTEVSDILQLQAGITVSSGGDLHMRGGRKGQIAYQIDGVPVTDAFDQSNVIDVNANSIQELQVVSGAFNAEFGQAMSGIVNIVTKDGSNKFTGFLQSYIGDYASNKTDKFWNIDDINPAAIRNYEGSFSGPILKDRLFFYVNGKYYYNTGYLYGQDLFQTSDYAQEVTDDLTGTSTYVVYDKYGNVINPSRQSAEYVSMNPDEKFNGQGKLTFRLFPSMKINYNFMGEYQEFQSYDHGNRLTTDNNLQKFRTGYNNTVTINHAISNRSFYNLSGSYFFKGYEEYLFEDIYTGDPSNPTYYTDTDLNQYPTYNFNMGGNNHKRFTRSTGTITAKLDWSTQVTNEINVQFGGLFNQHRIYYEDIILQQEFNADGSEVIPYNVVIPSIRTTNYNTYLKKPYEASGYVQSKFEAFNMIFNAGVRFDVFNPNSKILSDPNDPDIYDPQRPGNKFNDLNGNGEQDPGEKTKTVSDRYAYWYKDASIKYQLSPRLGIAFPISDRGVIHFSYGHFFQLPSYDLLYTNPEFELSDVTGNAGLFGNADMKPQKTIKGEIGLQQQLGEDIGLDVTVFFEDFRDLTGTQTESINVFGGSKTYTQYANSDFGFSKGFIIKLQKRLSQGLAVNLDYTFSVTKGNSSNPDDARNAELGGAVVETIIAPLDWDQTHSINLIASYSKPQNYGFSFIFNYYTGQPYTPAVNKNTRVTQNGFPRNSSYKPNVFNIDMRANKDFVFGPYMFSIFLKVYNLLDLDNPRNIYAATGSSTFTFDQLEAEKTNAPTYYNTLDEYFTNPTYFSEPRRVEVGASFNF
jgi:outer membrane receptor for ferrienterochelin and colicin